MNIYLDLISWNDTEHSILLTVLLRPSRKSATRSFCSTTATNRNLYKVRVDIYLQFNLRNGKFRYLLNAEHIFLNAENDTVPVEIDFSSTCNLNINLQDFAMSSC